MLFRSFRFTARAWELQQTFSVAPHDCLGSNIYLHSRRQKVMRAIPRDNEAINETWLSDRDRFSYLAINSADRVTKPMVKIDGNWQETDWATALEKVVQQFKNMPAEQLAALISPSATTEELYLLQKLLRAIGCHNIDHRLHQTDFSDDAHLELYPSLGISIEELETQDAVLLIGANIQREQPLAAHRIRKATLRGARVSSVNVVDYAFNFTQQEKFIVSPNHLVTHLAAETTALANLLNVGERKIILLGAIAQNHPKAATIKALARKIAELSGAKIGYLTEGANAAGAWLAGAVPHRTAAGEEVANARVNTQALLAQPKKAYLLFGVEPQLDCANPSQALAALQQAEFVVACSPFKADVYLEHADVILPIAAFAETSGTFVNVEGRWQSFAATVPAPDETRPGWKVLRVLGNLLGVAGFDYVSSEDARDELQQLTSHANLQVIPWICLTTFQPHTHALTRITEWPIYSGDSVVRRASALQQSATHEATAIYINAQLAERLQLQAGQIATAVQGSGKTQLPIMLDARIPDTCVWIPAGRQETAVLGDSFGAIEIYA